MVEIRRAEDQRRPANFIALEVELLPVYRPSTFSGAAERDFLLYFLNLKISSFWEILPEGVSKEFRMKLVSQFLSEYLLLISRGVL